MKYRRIIPIAIFIASLLLASDSFATWNKIVTIPGGVKYSGFFFNELVGFIGFDGFGGIYKTTDGGKSWVKTTIPGGYGGNQVTSIFFRDQLNGWATIEAGPTVKAILKTVDGGLNWITVGPPGNFNCIYQTPSTLCVANRNPFETGAISIDGGLTFQRNVLRETNGIDFVDDLHGVATGFSDTVHWLRTQDGGRTWTTIVPFINTESWSVYGVKGSSVFYTAAEDDPTQRILKTKVMRSADNGATWSTMSSLPFYTTGHISGVGEVIYIQSDRDPSANAGLVNQGMYRSTDQGTSWQFVQGPSHDRDTRFVVTGCNGGILYAFDKSGNLWKTRDGGDGQIIEPPVEPVITGNPIVFSGKICETSKASLDIENLYCSEDTILSAELVDMTSDIITSGALKITVMPSFPLLLAPNSKTSINFDWTPSKLFHTDTTVTFKVKVRYYSKILQLTFDTTVTISAHAIGESPSTEIIPSALNFANVSFCDPHDTSFIIRNNGCDTLYLLGANASAPQHYLIFDDTGTPLTFPVKIAPGDSSKILIRLTLDSVGSYNSDLMLSLRHQGIGRDTSVFIAANVISKGSYSIPDSIDFGFISTCRPIDSLVKILNLGCLPLTISSASLKKGTVFSLIGAPPYTNPILPNGSGTIHLGYAPIDNTTQTDELTITLTALGELLTKTIYIKGTGLATTPKLVTSLIKDTLFDLKLTRCDTIQKFPIVLSNPGCDPISTISITDITLQGASAPDITLTLGSALPTAISDVRSTNLFLTVDPKVIGTFNGSLHITYQIKGENFTRDTLLSYFLSVRYGARILSVDHDTIDLGTMKFCDTRDSAVHITNMGCDVLDSIKTTIQGQGNFTLTGTSFSLLGPNQKGNVSFHFEPTQAGAVSATMTITSVSDTLPIHTVMIKAFVIPTDTLVFSMQPTRGTFFAGDTLTVRLLPQRDVHGKGLRDAAFTMNFNADLLTLLPDPVGIKVLMNNAQYIAGSPSGPWKHRSMRIFLQGLPTLEIDKDAPVLEFRFLVSLTDSITTRFDLSDIQLNGGANNFSKCELGLVSVSLAYDLAFNCGDSTLVSFMQLKKNFRIFTDAVYPNPITSHTNYQGIIPFSVGEKGIIAMEIYDQLGRTLISKQLQAENAGSYQFTIDGSSLAAGCYTYLLHEITNSSASVRGRFIISK